MDSALPEEVVGQLELCNARLAVLEEKAKPLLNKSAKDIDGQMDLTERAQTYLALAHTVSSLLGLFLKVKGVPPEEHDTKKVKAQLKAYDSKVRKVVAEKELSQSRRSLEVNVAALNRVITHAVPDLSVQQRQALKQGPAKKKAGPPPSSGGDEGEGSDQQGPSSSSSRKRQRRGAGPRDEAMAFLEETMAEICGSSGGSKSVGRGSGDGGTGQWGRSPSEGAAGPKAVQGMLGKG